MQSKIIPTQQNQIIEKENSSYRVAMENLLYVLSETSKRQYAHTFRLWINFCSEHSIDPIELTAHNVIAFLEDGSLAKATKQARLTHLRRLAQSLYSVDTTNNHFRTCHEQLSLLKIKNGEHQKRDGKALNQKEVYEAFGKWDKDNATHSRNRAILAIAFYAGLRRSEIVALTWNDIDLENGLITVRHGKGDKERTIPLTSDTAIEHLKNWRAYIPEYQYVFPSIHKGGEIQDDKPISDQAVYNLIKATGDFTPHDGRRTLITGLLNAGTALHDAQFIAGHANGSTTMGYAKVKDAKEVKGRVKLNY